MACQKRTNQSTPTADKAFRQTQWITHNQVSVQVVIDKPIGETVDVIVAYHGTVFTNDKILEAANTTLEQVRRITTRPQVMIVSVAYPEEGLLMGENLREAEAALLWVKERAAQELGISIRKIFLVGHSQGGYLVTRLNTLHQTDGVVSNGPGPLNLVFRCQLEENGQAPGTPTCRLQRQLSGSVLTNPAPYFERSLLNFTRQFKAPILFVQGMNDSSIQLNSWPTFKQQIEACTDCAPFRFLEVPNGGHTALFDNPNAISVYNQFLSR